MIPQAKRAIPQPRRAANEVAESYEDAGLFRSTICQLMIELIPLVRRSDRGDVIVRGFVDRKTEIDVFFAGRRVAEIAPLERRLRKILQSARKAASAAGGKEPKIENVRLPIKIEGAWRRSMQRDETGWETGSYHFVAARWTLLDEDGKPVSYGFPPSF